MPSMHVPTRSGLGVSFGAPGTLLQMNDSQSELSRFEYTLDASDLISTVSAEWVSFARENEAPGLTPDQVVGHPLREFISDEETRLLYQVLMNKVRKTREPLSVKFRCDSPTLRRFMELLIEPMEKEGLRLTGHLLASEPRDAAILLDCGVPRDQEFLLSCSWCKRVQVGGEWVEVEKAIEQLGLFDRPRLPRLSHGICPDCNLAIREQYGMDAPG